MHHRIEKTITLPRRHACISTENWFEQVNEMADADTQCALLQLGPETAVEIAFATIQTYLMLTYSAAIPAVEHDGHLPARIATLSTILKSCGINIDTQLLFIQRHV